MEIILQELAWLTWIRECRDSRVEGKVDANAQHPMQFRQSGSLASTRLVVSNLDFIMACKRSETDGKILPNVE